MKKILIFILFCVTSVVVTAQDYKEYLKEDIDRAGSVYYHYEYVETNLTKAPAGFKPFYISHYGRHGSRYHTSDRFFKKSLFLLHKCDSLGLLTAKGDSLMHDLQTLYNEHIDMFGMLSQRGADEHQAIAARMVKNFPEVFALKSNRDKVLGVSSHVQRCIVSMANFSVAISKASPKMQFTFLTGPKHKAYIAPEVNMGKAIADGNAMTAEMAKSLVNPDRLISSIFVSYPEEIIGDKYLFMQSLYEAGAISPNTDCKPDIFKYFTEDELIGQWVMRNDKFYRSFGLSKEDGWLTAEIAKPIVKDIISKAEEAVRSDSDKALDMRFGHDTALLPLVGFLAIEGMEMPRVSETVHEYWNSSLYMSMASNLQMIFYKNKENRILVKLLYNEKERLIPAIKSYSGPYYEWDILLNYLHNLIK